MIFPVTTLFLPTDPPKTPTLTVFVEPQGGLQGILDCRVDSEPPASLTLHLGSQLVASNQPQGIPTQPHIHVSASPNALRLGVEELGPSNQGEYVCTASNVLGSASASAYFGTRGEENGSTSHWNHSAHRFSCPSQISSATRQHVCLVQMDCLELPCTEIGDEVKVKISSIIVTSGGVVGA